MFKRRCYRGDDPQLDRTSMADKEASKLVWKSGAVLKMAVTEIKSEERGILKEIIKEIKRKMKEKAPSQGRKTTNVCNLLAFLTL